MDVNRKVDIFFKDIECPVCKSKVHTNFQTIDIPHFGETIIFTLICEKCGYKKNDLFNVYEQVPKRHVYSYDTKIDLNVRVIRSSTCTVKIPEFGSIIDPGAESEGYITNIEGILLRINDILDIIEKDAQDEESFAKVNELREKIKKALKGEFSFTLILEDPQGNSGVISEDESKLTIEKLNIAEE